MRVGYFGYFVKSRVDDQAYVVDLRRFIRAFSQCPDVPFRSRFRYGGEQLLLQPLDDRSDTYLFVQSRDLELVKRIERRNLSAADLAGLLGANNGIGFATYVVVGDCWLSFACRVLSPRQTAFSHFMNSLFQSLGINYDFVLRTLQAELAPALVPQLSKVGRIDIQVNAASPIWQSALDLLTGGDGEEVLDASEVHVTIVPKRKKSSHLGPTLNSIIENVPPHGVESLKARGKLEDQDRMSDMYIYGAGAIRDYVFVDHEHEVPAALERVRRANAELSDLLEEFKDGPDFETGSSASDLGFNWARAYANRVDRD